MITSDFAECTDLACPATGGPGESGTFTVTSADDDVVTYLYGWSSPPANIASTQQGDSRTLQLTPPRYGDNTLYIQAVDLAGNTSVTGAYSFVVGRAKGPVAGWELETRPDGTQPLKSVVLDGPSLTTNNAVGWTPDVRLMGATTADFDGSAALMTDASVVDTSESFSVSAWVRLDGSGSDFHVGGFDGMSMSALSFGYTQATGHWYLTVPSADSASGGTWVRAESTNSATRNQWTHLVAVIDHAEGTGRLYVNGESSGAVNLPQGWTADGAFRIGSSLHNGAAANGWQGQIASVRVFDRVVVPEDLSAGTDDFSALMAPQRVGQWSFDEDCCGLARDQSNWNNDLSLFGGSEFAPGYQPGSYGISVDGVDGFAASTDAVFRTDDSFSISAWARLDSKTSDFTVVSSEAVVRPSSYVKYKPGTDRWRMTIPDADVESPGWYIAEDTTTPEVGEWYHLVSIYDAATDELRLYVNGALVSTVADPTEPWHVDGRLLLGAAGSIDGSQWSFAHGAIDDVAIYQGVLTETQIAELSARPQSDN